MKPLIQGINLNRSMSMGNETLHILKDLSFVVDTNEWLALTGPSGSGKSTLLALLAGIDSPTSGQLIFDGQDISRMAERELAHLRNQKIGIVFQSFHLIPSLTAQENVELPLYISPRAKEASRLALEMLELVGLSERLKHRPHQLSGGQQQRVAIARALVNQPALLLADEPTGNLDTKTGEQMLELFATLRQSLNLTLVIVTHDKAVASHADRVLHLVDGQFTTTPEKEALHD
jgi:putative ABC transport system ATP-binding protein